ncbi:MAG: SRPBCC domain-containing protein [Novosphingobium sp.]
MKKAKRGGLGLRILLLLPVVLFAQPARAEVVTQSENGFVVRVTTEVTAKPADAWRTLINPAQWWSSQHTFSGDAANLILDPVVGGCFCETLPRPDGAPAAQKPGGVQHMRVIYLEPPRAMRLVGALGPLQSEALAATMTMTIKPTDRGSRILFEYVVGGFMRYKPEEIAPAVDRMLTGQVSSLAAKLGPVEAAPAAAAKGAAAAGPPASDAEELSPAILPGGPKPVGPLSGVEDYRLPPAGAATAEPAPKPAPKPDAKPPASAASSAPAARSKIAGNPAAKPAVAETKPPAIPSAKSAAKPAANSVVKPAGKVAAKPVAKAAAKAPDDDAHRDANTAFDAALGATPAP